MIEVQVGPALVVLLVGQVLRAATDSPEPCTCDRCRATLGAGDVTIGERASEPAIVLTCPGCRAELGAIALSPL